MPKGIACFGKKAGTGRSPVQIWEAGLIYINLFIYQKVNYAVKKEILIALVLVLFGCVKTQVESQAEPIVKTENLDEKLPENVQDQTNTELPNDPPPVEGGLNFEEKAWQQRIENVFRKSFCPEPKPHNLNYYSRTLIDTHIHIQSIPDSNPNPGGDDFGDPSQRRPLGGVDITIDDLVCTFKYEGTQKAFAFFPVFPNISQYALEVPYRTMQEYPDVFIPFIMPPDGDDKPEGFPTVDAKTLEEMLLKYPGLFKGYGEIGLYARQNGSPELPPDSDRLLEIYPILRENGLLAYVHLGEGQKESFEKVLDANPDIKFIWHGDQLISHEGGSQNLSEVEDILSNYPNAYYGIDELYGDVWLLRPEVSKEEFLGHFTDYKTLLEKDVETWKGFIERHPDQVLWGTDRGWSSAWSVDEEVGWVLTDYSRAFISKLDPSVQEKFAYKNAEKLLED